MIADSKRTARSTVSRRTSQAPDAQRLPWRQRSLTGAGIRYPSRVGTLKSCFGVGVYSVQHGVVDPRDGIRNCPRIASLEGFLIQAIHASEGFANLTRQPAISVPVGLDSEGMPRAVQVAAALYRDDLCFRAARALEIARQIPTAPVL